MIISSLAFAYSAFAMLCAAMCKHYSMIFQAWKRKPPTWLLQFTALILLVFSLIQCMHMWGATVGFSAWWLVMAIPAYLVVLTYTYLKRFFIPMGLIGLTIGLISLIGWLS